MNLHISVLLLFFLSLERAHSIGEDDSNEGLAERTLLTSSGSSRGRSFSSVHFTQGGSLETDNSRERNSDEIPQHFASPTRKPGPFLVSERNNNRKQKSLVASIEDSLEDVNDSARNTNFEIDESFESTRFFVRPLVSGKNFASALKPNESPSATANAFEKTAEATRNQNSEANKSVNSRRFFTRPIVGGKNFASQLNVVPKQNTVTFSTDDSLEITNLNPASRNIQEANDSTESREFSVRLVENGRTFAVDLNQEQNPDSSPNSDEKSFEVIKDGLKTNLVPEVKNSAESQEFTVRLVENGKNFAAILSDEETRESSPTSDEKNSFEEKTSAESKEFSVRLVENGKNFAAILNNEQNDDSSQTSDENSLELTNGFISSVSEAKNSIESKEFSIRTIINGKNFASELNKNNPFKAATDFSVRPVVDGKNFATELNKNNPAAHFSVRPVVDGKNFATELNKNDPLRSAAEFSVKPVVDGKNFAHELLKKKPTDSSSFLVESVKTFGTSDEDSLEVDNFKVFVPVKPVTTNFPPTVSQGSTAFKKSFPQKAITKFGVPPPSQTREQVFHFTGYPSSTDKVCLEGEVIGLDGRCTYPEVIKNIYIYQKPLREFSSKKELQNPPKPKIKINLVVIRSNGQGSSKEDPIIIPPPQEKTVVLVLDKEEEYEGRKVIEVTQPPSGDPEVYFVDYKDGENPLLPGGIDLQEALGTATLRASASPQISDGGAVRVFESSNTQQQQQNSYVPPRPQQPQETLNQPPKQQYQPPKQQYQPPSQLQRQYQAQEVPTSVASQDSSSDEQDSPEVQQRLLPAPTRLLNLKQNNARRSRATGVGIASWGRLRTGSRRWRAPSKAPRE